MLSAPTATHIARETPKEPLFLVLVCAVAAWFPAPHWSPPPRLGSALAHVLANLRLLWKGVVPTCAGLLFWSCYVQGPVTFHAKITLILPQAQKWKKRSSPTATTGGDVQSGFGKPNSPECMNS